MNLLNGLRGMPVPFGIVGAPKRIRIGIGFTNETVAIEEEIENLRAITHNALRYPLKLGLRKR